MERRDLELMARIVRSYYEQNLTQPQIAAQQGISKSSVNRILKRARELGHVVIELNLPAQSCEELAQELGRYFSLRELYIAPAVTPDKRARISDVARALALNLNPLIEHNDIIGVSLGTSVDFLSKNLAPLLPPKENLKIVQLRGFMHNVESFSLGCGIVERFSAHYGAKGYILPTPVFTEDEKTAEMLRRDSQVAFSLELARRARIFIFSVGAVDEGSSFWGQGEFSHQPYRRASERGAVGDVLGHCFTLEGELADERLERSLIGISVEEMKPARHKIALVVGHEKARATVGALRAGLIDMLYTDELTAGAILEACKKTMRPIAGK